MQASFSNRVKHAPFSYLTLYGLIVNESSGPERVTHHIFYSVQKIAVVQRKKRVILTLPHRISNPKSLISLQPTKAFMRLSWCVSGIWGWEVFTTAHKVILAATSPSQMGNIAFILRGAAPQIWNSQKWCVTYLGAKNPRLGWDIRRRVLGWFPPRRGVKLAPHWGPPRQPHARNQPT